MKIKIFLSLIGLFLLVGCSNNISSSVFESEKLKGKYEVNVNEFLDKKITKNEEGFFNKLSDGIIKLTVSSINMELSFFDNNKGVFKMDGAVLSVFGEGETIQPFEYKVENDSILCVKIKEDKEYRKWAIIQKFSDNYDYLKLLIIDKEFTDPFPGRDNKVYFILDKIND